jgi:very-short-patch-repair endonuclease/predicted transcriptional regulator of viral defense system
VVAWVADRQLGLITTPQLHAAGVRRGSVEWRLATGTLHPRHRGVYLVGHAVPVPGANELAAVLACGERTFVSHRSAVALWGVIKAPPGGVEVTVVARGCRSRDGLLVHRVPELAPADRAERRGIPVTSAARALIDYASVAGYEETERAIAEAFALKLTTEPSLVAATRRAPNRAGVARVNAILGQPGGPSRTRSGGERAMLRLIRAAGLPEPLTNHPLHGYNADFFWPDVGLIVELDGGNFHRPRPAFERDHRRDIVHTDAGHEVLRVSGQQLDRQPIYIAAVVVRAYDRRSRTRG